MNNLINILKSIADFKQKRYESYKPNKVRSDFRHIVHNKGFGSVDFITEYDSSIYSEKREQWEQQYFEALKQSYKWIEFQYISLSVAIKYARNKGFTGLIVAKDGWQILLPKGCGQAKMVTNIGKSIVAGFKAHNAGAKSKAKRMQGNNKAEIWKTNIKKWEAVTIVR